MNELVERFIRWALPIDAEMLQTAYADPEDDNFGGSASRIGGDWFDQQAAVVQAGMLLVGGIVFVLVMTGAGQ